MIKILLLPLCLLVFGCASILNTKDTVVRFRATEPGRVLLNGQTYPIGQRAVWVQVPRSKQPISVLFSTDSTQQEVQLPSKLAFEYWCNLFTNYGIGMLVDGQTIKRFDYPRRVEWRPGTGEVRYNFRYPPRKGTLRWKIGIPYANHFRQRMADSTHIQFGFLGLSTGFEYFYRPTSFFSLEGNTAEGGAAISNIVPFPVGVDYFGPYETSAALYLKGSHHHLWRRWDLGYGVHYTRHFWRFEDNSEENPRPSQHGETQGIGPALSINRSLGRRFYAEINYQPTLWSWEANRRGAAIYQHLLSLEIGWKF